MFSSFRLKCFAIVALAGLLGTIQVQAFEYAEPDSDQYLITVGDPADPKYANAGSNLANGVGALFIEFAGLPPGYGFVCTAAAISDVHILTAAHCVRETNDTVTRVRFVLSAGLPAPLILDAQSFTVHPWYDIFSPFYGAFAHGDLAIVELAEPLPADIDTYDIYRDFDEFDKMARHYGHGSSGKGTKGATSGSEFFYARTGLNAYEQVLSPLLGDGIDDQLIFDFDSGGSKHNAMAWWFSTQVICGREKVDNPPWAQDGQCTTLTNKNYPDHKGYRKLEVGSAPGDSGGPAFIDGKIAGVHSFGFTHYCSGVTNGTDFTCGLDSSFGEMSGDTRVSFHADFIDLVLGGAFPSTPIPEPVPEPAAAESAAVSELLSPMGHLFMNNTFSAEMRGKVE